MRVRNPRPTHESGCAGMIFAAGVCSAMTAGLR